MDRVDISVLFPSFPFSFLFIFLFFFFTFFFPLINLVLQILSIRNPSKLYPTVCPRLFNDRIYRIESSLFTRQTSREIFFDGVREGRSASFIYLHSIHSQRRNLIIHTHKHIYVFMYICICIWKNELVTVSTGNRTLSVKQANEKPFSC